jgi:molecular chaperone DnaK
MATDNKSLGKFHLVGIPPAPRGIPQIEVTFDIDANGILNVSARDKATGKEQKITITSSSGLAKDEIEQMVRNAQSFEADDKHRREQAELRNQVDSLTYNLDKLVRENSAKIDGAQVSQAQELVKESRDKLGSQDPSGLEPLRDRLNSLTQQIATQLYQQASAGAGPAGGPGAGPGAGPSAGPQAGPTDGKNGRDDVVDAEYSEIN